jgi:pyruvate kinase
MNRRAKVVATIGPSCDSEESLRALLQAGMNIARLNMSHGSHEEHEAVFRKLRKISKESGHAIGILQDLQGPKIRTGDLVKGERIQLQPHSSLVLTAEPILGTSDRIHVNYPHLTTDLSEGDKVLMDDGRIEVHVTEIRKNEVVTEVISGGSLGSHKGVNFPGITLSTPGLTEKDEQDLAFGLRLGVDAIALSFVRRASNLVDLRRAIERLRPDQSQPPIIAKLERPESVEHLDEILSHADGVMVARGDLGVEVSPEKVPSLQKRIIQQAMKKRKIAITATQMLESMIRNPRPTRAEASDVANAIFDGSDALMLSGETAVGSYPVNSVETMIRIILDAEAHMKEWGFQVLKDTDVISDDAIATTHAARELADDREAQAIAVFTRSGRTACFMANTRPNVPIFAFTPEEQTFYRLSLLWGVEPQLVPMSDSVEEMIMHVESALLTSGRILKGQQVVLVASLPIGAMGPANFTLLHTIT